LGRVLFNITVLPLFYLLSVLPFPLLFLLSDILFLIVYYGIGYRRNVVITNLRNSFPQMADDEVKRTARKFYRHFCDVMFETIKLLTISPAGFRKRCAMDEAAIATFGRFITREKSIVGVMGHCGNWEWGAISHQLYFERMITGVYHPLSNQNFDRLMLNLRGRFGGDIVPMKQVYKRLLSLRDKGISTTIGLIADQTPPPESAYWTTFLNQDTPVFNGPEKLAKKFNYPVIYLKVIKLRRGYYKLSTVTITDDPSAMPEGAISELHARALENNIREQPYAWLWSHRRWKHKRPVAG
jgi:Kdo2-lipid IVA lauroyltransferase/acyltransferase